MSPLSTRLIVCALSTLASGALLANKPPQIKEMKPGQYSYTIETEMKGVPFKIPPTTFQHCVTKADIEEGKAMKSQKDAGMECKYEDVKSSGGRYQFTANCSMKDGMKMRTVYDMTAAGDTVVANIKSQMSGPNIPPNMGENSSKMTMKRTGDCTK
jgi:hypothetical protein